MGNVHNRTLTHSMFPTGQTASVPPRERREVVVRGIVQGVGFRPFIYALATRLGLTGSVRNDAAGVTIEAEGEPAGLDAFLAAITAEAPPLALVEAVSWRSLPAQDETGFRIADSQDGEPIRTLISPDVATCDACLTELFDLGDRRYRYPFINCTHCGPRFTITRAVPYDRSMTTMAGFPMCDTCRREYDDPTNRRFHAQPNACPICGPRVTLLDDAGREMQGDPVQRAAEMLRVGAIVALKGLGGYHLACDPFDPVAVATLRARKARQDKAFALMARDVDQVQTLCVLRPVEEALITNPARPIVLLEQRREGVVAEEVAPRQRTLGVMLAYTPLHHLLLHDAGAPLVMTSGNRCDEPIAYHDEPAREQLAGIADYFLVHDRPIHMRCDDSVVRSVGGLPYPIRRSRGFAPAPLTVTGGVRQPLLACGAELKNTFALARGRHIFLSHHIGDLENAETLQSFAESVAHYCRLFDVQPEALVYDLHPEYLSTKYALEREEEDGIRTVGVQHHHAHIAACLADNDRPTDERVIGVALDGTGYGTDGAIWGGEFLVGSAAAGFERRAHLAYVPLPGGSAAVRQPWRMAVAYLRALYSEEELLALPLDLIRGTDESRLRPVSRLAAPGPEIVWLSPPTSSAGRLFDAVSALLGVAGSLETTYEGQAAVELELLAGHPADRWYPFVLRETEGGWIVETAPTVGAIVEDLLASEPRETIAARFHRTMAEVVVATCQRIKGVEGLDAVALSGGTFQNVLLLQEAIRRLEADGFTVYRHQRVPANDGGIALGQAILADSMLRAAG